MRYIYSVNGQEKKGPFESVDALVASIRERQFVSQGTEDLIRTHFSTTNTEPLWLRLTARHDTIIETCANG